jgi:glutamyl-Q tRNA(Asp) synthetase
MSIVTRFAPSPTGFLHLGHAFAARFAWRRAPERFLLRLEDIDATRCRPEFSAATLEDLAWLGLHWHGEVRVQSEHLPDYAAALAALETQGLLYPCFCTRREIAAAQAAPHGAEPVYPGTCRHLPPGERVRKIADGMPYALRLDSARAIAASGALRFFEEGNGWVEARPERLGDVVLARKEMPTSYHLCAVHDDALQGVTLVTRGEDLAEATHLHVLLQHVLRLPTPRYAHHRLITDSAGRRLAKRDAAASLRSLRAAGVTPAQIFAGFESECAA